MTVDRSARRRIVAVAIGALLIPIIPFAVLGELPGERWLSAHDDNALRFAALGAGLLAFDVLLPIPSSIVGSLLGARLGFGGGFAAVLLGLCLGNVVGYWLGRLVPQRFAPELPRTPSFVVLFLSRPVPVLAEAAVIAAGVARLSFARAFLSTVLGNAIYAALLAASGAAWLPDDWFGVGLVVPFGLPVVAWLSWRWLTQRARTAKDASERASDA
jgi:uncharacterized membrane protein YdjX (TVP38/TMEM64 family)